jgi:imidazole glycerol-phosphate synthase subunit HisH
LKNITVSIIDYSVGNYASVIHTLRTIGFKAVLTHDQVVLDDSHVIILPGVGAFPSAMKALSDLGLVEYLQERAENNKPIVGICLGMQLLTESSHEQSSTKGLGIIPGNIVPLKGTDWHIGWNTLECSNKNMALHSELDNSFYFCHSYIYSGPDKYQRCFTRHHNKFASIIRNGNTVGLQFHPEKSQTAGRKLLKDLINGIVDNASYC